MHEIKVRHNFETAHRLPQLPGKCQSLHGHSWWAEVTVQADTLDGNGLVVEFGPFKKALREWIDTELDHGTILGQDDDLVEVLRSHGCKVFVLPYWPTVELVAELIAFKAIRLLQELPAAATARVARVDLQETHVNGASWVFWARNDEVMRL